VASLSSPENPAVLTAPELVIVCPQAQSAYSLPSILGSLMCTLQNLPHATLGALHTLEPANQLTATLPVESLTNMKVPPHQFFTIRYLYTTLL
jgi:hypothetical protein